MKNYKTINFNVFKKKSVFEKLLNITFFIIIWFCLVSIAFSFVYLEVRVSGPSMKPTLNQNWSNFEDYKKDTAYINRLTEAKRSDIIVYCLNNGTETVEDDEYVIKRLIAIGGDTVAFRYNEANAEVDIFITGNKLEEDYVVYSENNSITMQKWLALQNAYPELFAGDTLTIPDGFIFFLGDNRANSTDCLILGPQALENIVGKVEIINPYGTNLFTDFVIDFIEGVVEIFK